MISQSTQTSHASGVARSAQLWPAIATLVLLSIVLRTPGLFRPLVGPFATKSVTYAMIARNWATGRAPFWLPTTDCMAGGDRGWHLLEIPVAAYLAGAGWAVCGGSLDAWGRAVSIAFSAAGVALLFVLVQRWHGRRAAWVAGLVLVLSPLSVFFGQTFMLESSVVFFMLLTLWSMEAWLATACGGWACLTAASLALMLCTKIYMAVMFLPLAALMWQKMRTSDAAGRRRWIARAVGMGLVGASPAIIWCGLVAGVASADNPESARVFFSLCRSASGQEFPNPLLGSTEFYARLFKNLAFLGLTPVGLALASRGMLHPAGRRHAGWLAALGVLVLLLPGKFFELRYYSVVLVPALAVLAGLGWESLHAYPRARRLCGSLGLLGGLGCSLWTVLGPGASMRPEDRGVIAAATALDRLAAPDEPVATLHGSGSDLLYYCDRPGWALSANDRRLEETLEACRRQGARWLVVADLTSLERKPAADAVDTLSLVCSGDDYRIYRIAAGDAVARRATVAR
ncbi:MAG TPA: glycosyltransferase family 39 protein [Pirellulales bacterium]|nr:glycosyltransferase family 39 protein [Pirellulales bacterium]